MNQPDTCRSRPPCSESEEQGADEPVIKLTRGLLSVCLRVNTSLTTFGLTDSLARKEEGVEHGGARVTRRAMRKRRHTPALSHYLMGSSNHNLCERRGAAQLPRGGGHQRLCETASYHHKVQGACRV